MKLDLAENTTHQASEMLLGHNLETCIDTVPGLLSDRLDNAKFVGPAHPMTGIAPGWEGGSIGFGARYELTPDGGLMGSEAQLMETFSPAARDGLTQNKRSIRRGETLEVEIWARAWQKPATLVVQLLPMPSRQQAYATAEVTVSSSWYRRYTATLTVPVDDDDACFRCALQGEGAVWLDQIHLRPQAEPLLCSSAVDAMASLHMPTVRFPGGIITNTYNWRHGTGPVHLRPTKKDASFHRDWYLYYDFGTDELLELCRQQGVVPTLTVNLGTGTPAEAGEWAAYCAQWYRDRDLDLPRIYWHIGNHPYHTTTTNMTGEMYLECLNAYIPAIREAYPPARIVAVVHPQSRGRQESDNTPWEDRVLDEAADLIDLVAIQTYAGQGVQPAGVEGWDGGTRDPREQMATMVNGIGHNRDRIAGVIEKCRTRGLGTRVAIAEWNYWTTASHRDGHNFTEPDDALHALAIAGMLHHYVRLAPDLEAAHFYNLVNVMGILIHRGADVVEAAGMEVFRLYRPALPGAVLPVTLDSPALGDGPAVDSLALHNDSGTWLFLANRHPETAHTVDLPTDLAAGALHMLQGERPDGPMAPAEAKREGAVLHLPPLTLVRVHRPA